MYPPVLGLVDAMLERYIRFAICASRRFPDYFLKGYRCKLLGLRPGLGRLAVGILPTLETVEGKIWHV